MDTLLGMELGPFFLKHFSLLLLLLLEMGALFDGFPPLYSIPLKGGCLKSCRWCDGNTDLCFLHFHFLISSFILIHVGSLYLFSLFSLSLGHQESYLDGGGSFEKGRVSLTVISRRYWVYI